MIGLIYFFIILVGLCVGSFLNVVIYRVPNNMIVISPPSHCPNCKKRIRWYDNIPILSFLILKGRCRHCGEKISLRYLFVELLNAILWAISCFLFFEKSICYCILVCFLCSVLLCIAIIDFEHKIIPDRFHIFIIIIDILLLIFVYKDQLVNQLLGCVFGGGLFLLFYFIGYLIYKKEALGFGDVKLMACCGLFLGFGKTLFAILIGSFVGSIILLCLNGKKKGKEYPFAPFLVFGILISIFLGDIVVSNYLSLF